jgi:multidrug efflux pump subunit AcrB
MYIFLQNFRDTLIPTIAVPIVVLGTFGVLAGLGYSINTLTMLAMVLAVGLLVDDAIVVVENVERVMEEDRLSPRDATRKSMTQISGALIGIALVLSAVFLPMAFLGGSTGVIYRQFSVTIVSTMVLSVLVALILTPAVCATLLKPKLEGQPKKAQTVRLVQQGIQLDEPALHRQRRADDHRVDLVDAGLRDRRLRHGFAVHAHVIRFSAGRGSGAAFWSGNPAAGVHGGADRSGQQAGGRLPAHGGEG